MTDQAPDTAPAPAGANGQPEEGWLKDGRDRLYVKRPNGKGAVFRRGDETIAQALERDATQPRDKRPRARGKAKGPRKPPAPTKVDLKELETVLAEALISPAMVCAMFGDEWAANHFTRQAPNLARNLVLASEHNPWLRRKLEDAATGQEAAMKMISLLGLGGALFGYAIPPIVWWLNLPVPDKAREMLAIPPAREHPSPDAPAETPTETPEPAAEPVAA